MKTQTSSTPNSEFVHIKIGTIDKYFTTSKAARRWLRDHGFTVRDALKTPDPSNSEFYLWRLPALSQKPTPSTLPTTPAAPATPTTAGVANISSSSYQRCLQDPLAMQAFKTTTLLAKELGISINVEIHAKGKVCKCISYYKNGAQPSQGFSHFKIIYSQESLHRHDSLRHGYYYSEYKSLQHLLNERNLSRACDRQAAHIIAIHEYCHAFSNQTRGHCTHHGSEYHNDYAMLLDRYAANLPS